MTSTFRLYPEELYVSVVLVFVFKLPGPLKLQEK